MLFAIALRILITASSKVSSAYLNWLMNNIAAGRPHFLILILVFKIFFDFLVYSFHNILDCFGKKKTCLNLNTSTYQWLMRLTHEISQYRSWSLKYTCTCMCIILYISIDIRSYWYIITIKLIGTGLLSSFTKINAKLCENGARIWRSPRWYAWIGAIAAEEVLL